MRTRMFQGLAAATGLLLLSAAAQATVQVNVGSASGAAGTQVNIDVSLVGGGAEVAATSNDIIFDGSVVSLTTTCASGTNKGNVCTTDDDCPGSTTTGRCNSNSACKINPDIGAATPDCIDDPTSGPCKSLNKAVATCPGPQSDPCPDGDDGKTRFRGIILATNNTTTIPDGVLYTCTFTIAAGATAGADLTNVGASSSDPSGGKLDSTGANGRIDVTVDTPTPTVTDTPVAPTATSTVPPTDTPVPTATKTNTPVPTATNTRAPGGEDDGCQIGAGHSSNSGWLMMLPVAALIVLRRRSR
ncbi:MAG TPA: hypothetical protein VMW17_02395 [Candidatus Binatia bacterium]|nr:hypothetical protein [Candidatus Binatia bacterium]